MGRQIRAGARAVFEEHRLAVGQVHDGLHVVIDRLDEAGAALGIFVLVRARSACRSGGCKTNCRAPDWLPTWY